MKDDIILNSRFFTIEEAANFLHVSYITVYRWIKSGTLIAYKIGKQYRINENDLIEYIKSSKYEQK